MSQRQVGLRGSGLIEQTAVSATASVGQAAVTSLSNMASYYKKQNEAVDLAMRNGQAYKDELIETYKANNANGVIQESLNKFIIEQSDEGMKFKIAAEKPNATQEQKDEWSKKKLEIEQNLSKLVKFAGFMKTDSEAYAKNESAVNSNSFLDRLTRDIKIQESDKIIFDQNMLKGQVKSAEFGVDNNGQITVKYNDGTTDYELNAGAYVEAYDQTGVNLTTESIGEDELIEKKYSAEDSSYKVKLSDWDKTIFKQKEEILRVYDPATNSERYTKRLDAVDAEAALLQNERPWLEQQTTNASFNKTWDQLCSLGYVSDKDMSEIPWYTVSRPYTKERANALLKAAPGADTDKKGGISEDEYNNYQNKFREEAVKGLAKFIGVRESQKSRIVQESEIEGKYRQNEKGIYSAGLRSEVGANKEKYMQATESIANLNITNPDNMSEEIAEAYRSGSLVVPSTISGRKVTIDPKTIRSGKELYKEYATTDELKSTLKDLENSNAIYYMKTPGDPTTVSMILNTDYLNTSNGKLDAESVIVMQNAYGYNDAYRNILGANPTQFDD